MLLTEIDARDLLTAKEAAAMCGVKPVTVRQWIFRGLLTHVDLGVGDKGRKLYHRIDVARAEKATRARAPRRSFTVAA
nr:helix-turn-helix domain-containing protein [Streptomyces sp. NBC_00830]